ncbi:MAG: hypothetical protein JXQ89_19425 [Pelagimonas sp.]
MDAYLLARFLHILFAAIWLSQNATSGRLAKMFARGGQDDLSFRSVKAVSILGPFAGVMTLSTGIWLVSLTGDWETAPIAIHVGATLALVLFLIGAWPVSRGWRKLLKASEQMEEDNLRSALAHNIARWSHISMGIWSVILAAMVFRHL